MMATGTAKILIVDDELKTRKGLSHILASKTKYTVTTAPNGLEAILMLSEPDCDFNVVITDMYMPVKSGMDVVLFIREMKMDIDIILISGGDRKDPDYSGLSNDSLIKHTTIYGNTKFLKKPFEADELINMIESGQRK